MSNSFKYLKSCHVVAQLDLFIIAQAGIELIKTMNLKF